MSFCASAVVSLPVLRVSLRPGIMSLVSASCTHLHALQHTIHHINQQCNLQLADMSPSSVPLRTSLYQVSTGYSSQTKHSTLPLYLSAGNIDKCQAEVNHGRVDANVAVCCYTGALDEHGHARVVIIDLRFVAWDAKLTEGVSKKMAMKGNSIESED